MDVYWLTVSFLAWTVFKSSWADDSESSEEHHFDHKPDFTNPDIIREYWPWNNEEVALKYQSPVDISTENATEQTLPEFIFDNYWENKKEFVKLVNDGHTVKFERTYGVADADRPKIRGGPLFENEYLFEQMHMHWGETDSDGSEHTLDGKKYSTEMHIVHYKAEYQNVQEALKYYGGIAVVSFFGLAEGSDNRHLSRFIRDLRRVRRCNSNVTIPVRRTFQFVKSVATSPCLPDNRYYAYPGSLTTPPYSENVMWIIFPCPFKISPGQLSEFRQLKSCHGTTLIHKNDREIQPFKNRPIIWAY